MSPVRIGRLDPLDPRHAAALVALLDEYAAGREGGGEPLAADAKARLPALLAGHPGYVGLLATRDGEPIGLANCFEGVSTFRARPLLNLHDVVVTAVQRGRGVGRALLAAAEAAARERGCCKLTLEVLAGNVGAIGLYRSVGFADYRLDPAMGSATFMEKRLD